MFKKMPPALLFSSILLLLLPAVLDNSAIIQLELLWLVQLLPIFWIFYYEGVKAGGLFTILSILLHLACEWKENVWNHAYSLYSIEILVALSIMKLAFFIGVYFLSKKLATKEKVDQSAYFDFLTGKPNRFFIIDHIQMLINQSKLKHQHFSVIYLNLNHALKTNDVFLNDPEEQLSIQVLEQIRNQIPPHDIAARLKDDEYIIILENSFKWQTEKTARSIMKTLVQPFYVNHQERSISPSIGISMYPENGETVDRLLTYADQTMKPAQEIYGYICKLSRNNTGESVLGKIQKEHALRKAIGTNELFLCYQTQVDIKTSEIVGVEALLRWKNPQLGLVSPADFIPLAEETGLILQIGEWVLQESCRQLKEWHEAGAEITMAINVSPLQLQDNRFTYAVKRILAEEKLDPRYLEIEITESMMQNYGHSKIALDQLRTMGVKIALDDFGTGFSSLSMLNQLPIDHLKIDQSFIRDAAHNHHSNTLIKTIIELAHNLSLDVIAEGIEKEEHICLLKQYNDVIGQGFYYNRPLPKNEIEKILLTKKKSIV